MPRELTFRLRKKEYQAVPVRIERRKLYGWSEITALDDEGEPLKMVRTDSAGMFVIPADGIGMGILSPDGEWVERSELKTVNEDGSPVELMPSSFDTVTDLSRKVTPEEFLDFSITAFYQLEEAPTEFIKAIGNDIYTFPFCYVDNCDSSPAFVLSSRDSGESGGKLFLLVGYRNLFDMLSIEQPGLIDETEEDSEAGGEDIDFSML